MLQNVDLFAISQEDLEKAERRVPIYAIMNMLIPEQLSQVEDDMIRVSLLTDVQRTEVENALAFDLTLSQMGKDVSASVHRYI